MAYPYQKHIWVTREIIRREYLQNIEDGIYDEQQERLLQEAEIRQDILDETYRATAEEDTLSLAIQTEKTRAEGVESTLNNAISAERQRATAAESSLNSAITTETTRATGVENSLDTRISNEYTRATGAESTLTTNLQAETTRAMNAESALGTRVTTLETITTRAYKASGSVYFIDLPAAIKSRQGNIYDILDAFTTTSEFLEGPGKEYPAHTDVVIVGVEGDYYNEVTPSGDENPSEEGWYVYDSTEEEYVLTEDTSVQSGTTYYSYADVKYMYNIGTGFFDTSNFVQKTDYATLLAAGIVKPDGTTTTIDEDGTIHSLGGGQGTAEAAERMIAPIEPDATASTKPYIIGQRLILNDVLYKSKTAIAVGDELVVGTNIELADNISTQLDSKAEQTEVNDIVNVLGAKNLIPLSVETQTYRGVTITVQDDGSIILNGTATASIYLGLTKNGISLESGKCILSGVSGRSASSYLLFTATSGGATLYQEIDGKRTAIRSENGDSAIFDINKMNTTSGSSYVDPSEINIWLAIANGYTCNNVLIKPMIRLASISDDTYEPYAMTNQQLTKETYKTDDSASTTINNTDYVPMSETGGAKKKTLWSTIIAKIKAALATVATSGSYTDLSNRPTIELPLQTRTIDANYKTSYRTETKGDTNSGAYISTVRTGTANVDAAPIYGSGIAWGMSDTHGYLNINYSTANAYIGGGHANKLDWTNRICLSPFDLAMSGSTYGYKKTDGTFVAFRKPTGNATAAQVLSGYTFSNASSDGLTGTFKHTSTATPTGGDLNNSQYNLGEQHSYRYVNTAVCYSAGRNSTGSRVNFCVQGTGELWIPVKTPFTCSKFTITEVTAESGGLSSSTGTIQLANNALNSYVSTQLYTAKNYTLNRANSDFVIVHATANEYKKIWIAGYVSE